MKIFRNDYINYVSYYKELNYKVKNIFIYKNIEINNYKSNCSQFISEFMFLYLVNLILSWIGDYLLSNGIIPLIKN